MNLASVFRFVHDGLVQFLVSSCKHDLIYLFNINEIVTQKNDKGVQV